MLTNSEQEEKFKQIKERAWAELIEAKNLLVTVERSDEWTRSRKFGNTERIRKAIDLLDSSFCMFKDTGNQKLSQNVLMVREKWNGLLCLQEGQYFVARTHFQTIRNLGRDLDPSFAEWAKAAIGECDGWRKAQMKFESHAESVTYEQMTRCFATAEQYYKKQDGVRSTQCGVWKRTFEFLAGTSHHSVEEYQCLMHELKITESITRDSYISSPLDKMKSKIMERVIQMHQESLRDSAMVKE